MPACLFCKRDDVPRVPLLSLAAGVLVAHVDPRGAPCHEGAAQETHSRMLGDDYPHDKLLDDDDAWAIDDIADGVASARGAPPPFTGPAYAGFESSDDGSAVTARPADSFAEVERRHAAELAEEPADLPDVEPAPPKPRPARKPRVRKIPDPVAQ